LETELRTRERRRARISSRSYLLVTIDAGGNVPPALGLAGRRLAGGHDVTVVENRLPEARVGELGAGFR